MLVNNAGLSPLYPSLTEVSEALYDKVFAVNLKGPFRLSTLIGERMAAAGSGAIINISSVEAARPSPDALPYAAAKAGLEVLTLGLARAYGPAVRVNSIIASPFLTDISKAWDLDAVTAGLRRSSALRRAGRPEEIVGAALYLASPSASFTTGSTIRVDGGALRPPVLTFPAGGHLIQTTGSPGPRAGATRPGRTSTRRRGPTRCCPTARTPWRRRRSARPPTHPAGRPGEPERLPGGGQELVQAARARWTG